MNGIFQESMTSCLAFERTTIPFLHYAFFGCKQEMTDAWFKQHENAVENHRKASGDASKTAQERAMFLKLYESGKNASANPVMRKPSIIFQEFRTDRSNYQIRRFNASDESDLPSGYSFSKRLPADPLNLQTIFAHTQITIYEHPKSQFKFWLGLREGMDYYQAEINGNRLGDSEAFFPPLGHDSDARGGILNEVDAFFAHPTSQMRVVARKRKAVLKHTSSSI